jgi:hypothetical protein
VFAHADGRRRDYSGAKANFSRLCKKLGVEGVTLHTWRHTFASHFVQQTGNVRALQEVLGHQDIRQTMIYAHTSTAHLQHLIEQLPSAGTDLPKNLPKPENPPEDDTRKPLPGKGLGEVGAAGFEPATSTV